MLLPLDDVALLTPEEAVSLVVWDMPAVVTKLK
jgi:hypothetical protein